jgi:hypothetical protein
VVDLRQVEHEREELDGALGIAGMYQEVRQADQGVKRDQQVRAVVDTPGNVDRLGPVSPGRFGCPLPECQVPQLGVRAGDAARISTGSLYLDAKASTSWATPFSVCSLWNEGA